MVIFNSYVKLPEGMWLNPHFLLIKHPVSDTSSLPLRIWPRGLPRRRLPLLHLSQRGYAKDGGITRVVYSGNHPPLTLVYGTYNKS